jgi:hypothetical protein
MNERLKQIMLDHGLHKYITEDCQHRMEMLAELVAEECAQICGSQADKKNIRKAFGLPVESNVKYAGPEAKNSIESQYNRPFNLPPIGEPQ